LLLERKCNQLGKKVRNETFQAAAATAAGVTFDVYRAMSWLCQPE
jgi:hypothetical protein